MPRCGATCDEVVIPFDNEGLQWGGTQPTPSLRDRRRCATAVACAPPLRGKGFSKEKGFPAIQRLWIRPLRDQRSDSAIGFDILGS